MTLTGDLLFIRRRRYGQQWENCVALWEISILECSVVRSRAEKLL
jgi:hypothetical protein